MEAGPETVSPHQAAAAPVDREPLNCLGCGYDLQALDITGNCPECGKPIRDSVYIPDVWITHPQWLDNQVRLLKHWARLTVLAGFLPIVAIVYLFLQSYVPRSWASLFHQLSVWEAIYWLVTASCMAGLFMVACFIRMTPNPHAAPGAPETRWRMALPYLALLAIFCDQWVWIGIFKAANLLHAQQDTWLFLLICLGVIVLSSACAVLAVYTILHLKCPRLTRPDAPKAVSFHLVTWTILSLAAGFLLVRSFAFVAAFGFIVVAHDLGWWLKDKPLLQRTQGVYYFTLSIPLLIIAAYVLALASGRGIAFLVFNQSVYLILGVAACYLTYDVSNQVRKLKRQALLQAPANNPPAP